MKLSGGAWIPVALLLLGANPPPSNGIPIPPAGEAWGGVEVPGFSIRGNARPEQLRTVARDLETLRVVLAHIAGDERPEPQPPAPRPGAPKR